MSLEEINELLTAASSILDDAASRLKHTELQPSATYVRHIGEALAEIFTIKQAIYAIRPELTPEYLNQRSPFPPGTSRRFGQVLIEAQNLASSDSHAEAIRVWEDYLASDPPQFFVQMAQTQLERLRTP